MTEAERNDEAFWQLLNNRQDELSVDEQLALANKELRQAESLYKIECDKIKDLRAENERLQQLIKEKDDIEDARKRYYEDKLESMQISLNNQYDELKSAQELNRELVDAAKVICDREIRRFQESKLPSIYIENLRLLINKAK